MSKPKSADSVQAKYSMGNAGSAIQQLFAAVFFAKNGQWCVCLNVLMLNYSLNVFRAVVPVDKRSFWCQKHQQLGFLMVPLTLWQLKHQPWVWPQVWGQRLWFPIIKGSNLSPCVYNEGRQALCKGRDLWLLCSYHPAGADLLHLTPCSSSIERWWEMEGAEPAHQRYPFSESDTFFAVWSLFWTFLQHTVLACHLSQLSGLHRCGWKIPCKSASWIPFHSNGDMISTDSPGRRMNKFTPTWMEPRAICSISDDAALSMASSALSSIGGSCHTQRQACCMLKLTLWTSRYDCCLVTSK